VILVRLPSGPCAELQLDRGGYVAGADPCGRIGDHQLVMALVVDAQVRLKAAGRKRLIEDRAHCLGDPTRQALADCSGNAIHLARGCRDRVTVAQQVGHQGADVVGQIDVFREPIDYLVDLGERCAALEGQGVERGEE
jgi:hypothetical protein